MDDLQFNASLDVLLASEGTAFVDAEATNTTTTASATPNGAVPHVVTTAAPSVISTSSSSATIAGYPSAPSATSLDGNRHAGVSRSVGVTHGHQSQPLNPSNNNNEFSAGNNDMKMAVTRPGDDNHGNASLQPLQITAGLNFPLATGSAHPYQAVSQPQAVGAPPSQAQGIPQQSLVPQTTTETRPKRQPPRTTPPPGTTPMSGTRRKRARGEGFVSSAVSEDESERQRRRLDRNLREQQRSHRITEQIGHLRDVLAASNIHFKPDKYSTLVSVVEYIKQLQNQSAVLDGEHKKLLDTIQRTNDMINSAHYPNQSDGIASAGDPNSTSLLHEGNSLEDEFGVFVNGLDYKSIFLHCGIALAVASIDGKLVDCNPEFEDLTGYTREELLPSEFSDTKKLAPVKSDEDIVDGTEKSAEKINLASPISANLSLFNLLGREDVEEVFIAMSRMLKQAVSPEATSAPQRDDYWSGVVSQCRKKDAKLRMNVTLVRSARGFPKFFNCSATCLHKRPDDPW